MPSRSQNGKPSTGMFRLIVCISFLSSQESFRERVSGYEAHWHQGHAACGLHPNSGDGGHTWVILWYHSSQWDFPSSRCILRYFLCALFFGNILGVLTACPWINPAAFDSCLTWFSKEFAVFWLVPCKWAECAFLLERGSLLNRSPRNGRRNWCKLVLSAPSGVAEAKLGTRPRSKRGKNQKTPREYRYNNVPIFSSWSSQEKPARELQGRVHRIHCTRIHWALSRTEQKWMADDGSESPSGSWSAFRFLSGLSVTN